MRFLLCFVGRLVITCVDFVVVNHLKKGDDDGSSRGYLDFVLVNVGVGLVGKFLLLGVGCG